MRNKFVGKFFVIIYNPHAINIHIYFLGNEGTGVRKVSDTTLGEGTRGWRRSRSGFSRVLTSSELRKGEKRERKRRERGERNGIRERKGADLF